MEKDAGERDEKKESDTMTNRSSGMLVHGYDWVLAACASRQMRYGKLDIIYGKGYAFRRMTSSYTNYFTHTDAVSCTSHIRRLIRLSELFGAAPAA